MFSIHTTEQLLKAIALACAFLSVLIGIWYIVRRPHLNRVTKSMLLLGLGAFPLIVSLTGNIASFEYTLSRPFCGSCHVMGPYLRDAEDPKSNSLAAMHSRNHKFGENSCYTCHADSAEAIRSGEMNCIDCHNEVHPLALSRRPKTAKAEVAP